MLSDVGYGLVLAVLTGYMAFKKKAEGELGRMSRMLFISGIGSIIWGFLFGGFFGDMLTRPFPGKIVVPSLWFNPMTEPDDPDGLEHDFRSPAFVCGHGGQDLYVGAVWQNL